VLEHVGADTGFGFGVGGGVGVEADGFGGMTVGHGAREDQARKGYFLIGDGVADFIFGHRGLREFEVGEKLGAVVSTALGGAVGFIKKHPAAAGCLDCLICDRERVGHRTAVKLSFARAQAETTGTCRSASGDARVRRLPKSSANRIPRSGIGFGRRDSFLESPVIVSGVTLG
jgi:hypothetical protein